MRNESARQLRAGSSRIIAYVFLDAGNPFFSDVARGAEEAGRENGLALVMCNSDGDAVREDEYLGLLLEQRVRGVLITAGGLRERASCGGCRRSVCRSCSSTGRHRAARSGAPSAWTTYMAVTSP